MWHREEGTQRRYNPNSYSTIYMGQYMTKVPYGCVHQNLANVAAVKFYLLRAFPENLNQLSSILTKIWRFEATYVIRFGM